MINKQYFVLLLNFIVKNNNNLAVRLFMSFLNHSYHTERNFKIV